MNTKIWLLFTVFLCSISSVLIAQSVNINMAKAIAENHMAGISGPSLKSAGSKGKIFRFNSVNAAVENKDTLYYILNDTINKGFVIVSADKRAWPILAYSAEGNFNEKKQPEAYISWMNNKKEEIEYIKKNNLQPDSATIASWQNLSALSITSQTTSVEPLIETQWGQGCYYNEMCPADARSGYCGHVPTGCVATAMAQIMKYWNYPTKGKDSTSYFNDEYGTISANFGATTYQWDQMQNSVTSQNDAVATLMYHCGVAAGMGYGPSGSATNLWPNALIDYFDYSSNAKHINSKDYTSTEWTDILKSELYLGHPVYYTTNLPSGDSHALVCDGYQGTDFFHFNWGWDGANDGYYYLKSLNSDSQIFNGSQTAIIKIIPSHLPNGYNGLILSNNNLLLNAKEGVSVPVQITVASSSNWTATSNQSWLKLSISSGTVGTSTLNLSTTENSTNFDRIASVTLTAYGFPPQLISIKQFHRYEVTAGGLNKLLGNDLTTTTNLTLKGTIDARDFKTMRDLMPALESIDLSEATIISYTGNQGPAVEFETYSANTIPEKAFASVTNGEYSRLTSFVFPISTTSIGYAAFNSCSSLTNLLLPPSLQSIDQAVFNNCYNLDSLFIPESVLTIGHQVYPDGISINVDAANPGYLSLDGVLYNKSKTELIYCQNTKIGIFNIPETVTTIGYRAFSNSLQITSFTIPSSVTTIETWAFSSCVALTSISIPSSVNVIGDVPFFSCRRLTSITVGNPIPVDFKATNGVFVSIDKEKCTLNVPYKTKERYCTAYQWGDFKNIIEASNGFSLGTTELKLTSAADTATVFMKSNVAWSVKSDQTWLSVSPASGTGDNTLTLITQEKTSEGTRNAKITVSSNGYENQIITVIQDGAAIKISAGDLATTLTSEELRTITLLKLTGTIDARDFKTMRDLMPRLTTVDLSEVNIVAYMGEEGTALQYGLHYYLANEIPEAAFALDYSYGKNSLRSFILPKSATSIDSYAFYNCWGLTNLSLPASLQEIGIYAFGYCKNLSNIFIPSSVATIFSQAFIGSLGPIHIDPASQSFSSLEGVLYDKNKTTLIQCPISKTESIIIPETVSVIGRRAFSSCSDITSVTIPLSVNQIQHLAFEFCSSLSSIIVRNPNPINLNSSDYVFFTVNTESCILYVPYGTRERYMAAEVWRDFKNIIELPNQAPIANAGPDQTINGGKLVTLNGTGSTDTEGNSLTYKWTAPTSITLNTTTVSKPTFSAPDVVTNTNFIFSLIVNDGNFDSPADQIIVTVTPNNAPIANAGTDQTVKENNKIKLDGTASSDPDNDELTYLWTAPAGITLNSITDSKPTFTAPEVTTDTNFTFSLVVNDGLLNSTTDIVEITVKNVNKVPVANAGVDQTVDENSTTTLDGSASLDRDENLLSYRWTSPDGITLSSTTDGQTTFIAPDVTNDTVFTFSLVVNDGMVDSQIDQIVITVKNVNQSPVANISSSKTVKEGETVTLDGSASSDLDGDPLTYKWTAPAEITLSSTIIAKPTFIAPKVPINTDYKFSLVVNDGTDDSPAYQVVIKVLNGNSTGTHEMDDSNELKFYPNPTNGKIKIVFDQIPRSGIELIVTDITGKTILKQNIQEKEVWIDLSGNIPGIYFIRTGQENIKVQKVILK